MYKHAHTNLMFKAVCACLYMCLFECVRVCVGELYILRTIHTYRHTYMHTYVGKRVWVGVGLFLIEIHPREWSCWNIWSCKEFKLSFRSVPNLFVVAAFIRVPTKSLLESRKKKKVLIKMLRDVGLVNIFYFDPGPQGYPRLLLGPLQGVLYLWRASKRKKGKG